MELSIHGAHIGGDLDKWALLQMSRQGRMLRQERAEQTQESLSKLLFGVDLSPDELRLYKAKLLDVISKVDALESGLKVSFKGDLAVPKTNLMYQVGNLAWLAPKKGETPLITSTPSQEIHSRNLAKNLQLLYSLNPQSVHRSFHTVGIVVGRAGEGTRWGDDKVELSQWALNVVNRQDYPNVASLRLPPRFPTQVEMVNLCVS